MPAGSTMPTGSTGTVRRRRDHPVVVPAPEGRTTRLRARAGTTRAAAPTRATRPRRRRLRLRPPRSLRERGRSRRPRLLERLRSATTGPLSAGATRSTGSAETRTTRPTRHPGRGPGRRRNRSGRIGAEARGPRPRRRRTPGPGPRRLAEQRRTTGARTLSGSRARRNRFRGPVHLRRTRALVVVPVTAPEGRRRRLLVPGRRVPARTRAGTRTDTRAGAGPRPGRAAGTTRGRRRPGRGRCVRRRRVRQEVPPALLAERRTALAGRTALRAQLGLGCEMRSPTGATEARATGPTGSARARRRGRRAGRRIAVTGTRRRRRWRRRGYGTGHTVTADLAPVVGTRLVSVRAGRHVGASPSPFRPLGRVLWPTVGPWRPLRAGVAVFGPVWPFLSGSPAGGAVTSLHEQSLWTASRESSRPPP